MTKIGCVQHDCAECEDLEALRLDATRYRWLRDRVPGGTFRIIGVIYSEGGASVDASIDAAMKGGAK